VAAADLKKILLVVPVFHAVYPRPFTRFLEMAVVAGRQLGYVFAIHTPERQGLVTAMNTAVAIVLDQAFDAMVIFDDDCLPPPDAIKRLLERCFDEGRPFVAGAGVMRGYPFTTTVAKYYKEGYSAVVRDEKWHLEGHQWLDDLPDALIDDVDFCGVPIAIVHRRVFERLGANCFGDQDRFGNRMTHDVYFCRKVKDAGFPVAVDGTIHCDHMVEAPIVSFDNRKVARALATGAARVQQHPCEEGVEGVS
jgi:GT2 family glycosyltransferase